MRLRDVLPPLSADVKRDAAFESLGLVSYSTPSLLVFLESERFLPELVGNPHVSAVITTAALAREISAPLGVAVATNPRATFYSLHNQLAGTDFYWRPFATEIDPRARVHPRAFVADVNVRIGPGAVVEPHATILERTVLGEDVVVRAGSVVGGEGFQYPVVDGAILPVVHAGGALLESGVEIQHNSCVDRAVFGESTTLGQETKIDNHVHIAHNCLLGKRNRVAAMAMVAGSVTTGDDVWFGPGCAISSGLRIGARASVSLGAVVTRDVPDGARVSGNFAIDHDRFIAHMRDIR